MSRTTTRTLFVIARATTGFGTRSKLTETGSLARFHVPFAADLLPGWSSAWAKRTRCRHQVLNRTYHHGPLGGEVRHNAGAAIYLLPSRDDQGMGFDSSHPVGGQKREGIHPRR